MRSLLVLPVLALLGLAAGCGDTAPKAAAYPPSVRANFLRSCEVKGDQARCSCVLQQLEARIAYPDYKRLEAAALLGKKLGEDPRVVDALAACR